MIAGCIAAGICCLIYYGFLAAVSMDFGWVWLAAGLTLLGGGLFGVRLWNLLPLAARLGAGVVLGTGILFFAAAELRILQGMLEKPDRGLAAVLVLGAQVRGTRPSRALTRRLERAKSYLEENPDTLAVLCGGQGEGEEITEARAMYNWLTKEGIDGSRLFMEDCSTSTQENLSLGAKVLEEAGISVKEGKPIGIVTNNFHICRSLLLAKKQGYASTEGIPAASDPRYQVHYLVREFFALVKEKLAGNI